MPDVGPGAIYKYRIRSRETATASTRPIRSRSAPRSRRAPAASSGTSPTRWGDAEWMAVARAARGPRRADARSTRCTSGSWRRVAGRRGPRRSATASSRRCWPTTSTRAGLHPRRAPADHGAPVLRLVGLPDDRLLRARPAATARRRTSCTSIDTLHQDGIGVILDWVPVALPDRRARPRPTSTARTSTSTPIRARASTPTGRAASSTTAATRCAASCSRARASGSTRYHVDGLRVDAVASMLYLDYSRKRGRVDPQPLRRPREPRGDRASCARSTRSVYAAQPGRADHRRGVDRVADGVAADRTSAASASASSGTWAGCTTRCDYFAARPDPPPLPPRRAHVPRASTRFTENFVLPLSHDEVVHGKGSLLGKMPGDDWQQLREPAPAVRLPVGAAGQEAAVHGRRARPVARVEPRRQPRLAPARRRRRTRGVARWVGDLNRALPRASPRCTSATATRPASSGSTRDDAEHQRPRVPAPRPRRADDRALSSFNFTPVPRDNYRVGVPDGGPLAGAAQQRRRRSTAAAAWATSAASRRRRCRCTARTALAQPDAAAARLPRALRRDGDDRGRTPALGAVPVDAAARASRSGRRGRSASRSDRRRDRAHASSPRAVRLPRGDGGRRRRRRALPLPPRRRRRSSPTRRRAGSRRASRPVGGRRPVAFGWTDATGAAWRSSDYVLYELHVGTFTEAGTFDARHRPPATRCATSASRRVELMPVAQFPGARNWGYDGVFPYAAQDSYGGPDGLRRLRRRGHARGPRGGARRRLQPPRPGGQLPRAFGPYFTDRYRDAVGPRASTSTGRTATRCAASSSSNAAALAARVPRRRRCGSTPSTPSSTVGARRSWRSSSDAVHDAGRGALGRQRPRDRRERPQRPARGAAAGARRAAAWTRSGATTSTTPCTRC